MEDAGVDLAEEGLRGSFLLPFSVPFSLGDLFPFVVAPPAVPSFESSTTKSWSLLSPSLSSFLSFLDSGDLVLSPGEIDVLCNEEKNKGSIVRKVSTTRSQRRRGQPQSIMFIHASYIYTHTTIFFVCMSFLHLSSFHYTTRMLCVDFVRA